MHGVGTRQSEGRNQLEGESESVKGARYGEIKMYVDENARRVKVIKFPSYRV